MSRNPTTAAKGAIFGKLALMGLRASALALGLALLIGAPAFAGDEPAPIQVATLDAAPIALTPGPTSVMPERDNIDREIVAMPGDHPRGTIVVLNKQRVLFLSLGEGRAIRYPVAIGKPGRAFSGRTSIIQKVKNPVWTPTPSIRKEHPGLPAFVRPGPKNPLGPRALYLGLGLYRIHGTNKPSSIGKAASHGCIRMHNADVVDLFERVSVGAAVIVR
jgi:lipoprotein-anchoring transpeptidase ErfK/SrfK